VSRCRGPGPTTGVYRGYHSHYPTAGLQRSYSERSGTRVKQRCHYDLQTPMVCQGGTRQFSICVRFFTVDHGSVGFDDFLAMDPQGSQGLVPISSTEAHMGPIP
jgi:hypothetical protein